MKRRSFLAALGLAPLASVVAAKATPSEFKIDARGPTRHRMSIGVDGLKIAKPGYDVLDPRAELIVGGSIRADTIKANHIDVGNLSALTAKL